MTAAIITMIKHKFRRWRLSILRSLILAEPESEQVRILRMWMEEERT